MFSPARAATNLSGVRCDFVPAPASTATTATAMPAPQPGARPPAGGRIDAVSTPLQAISHATIGNTRGKKCASGLMMNMTPAAAVTMPAAIANGRESRRSDPATVSIAPAALLLAACASKEAAPPPQPEPPPPVKQQEVVEEQIAPTPPQEQPEVVAPPELRLRRVDHAAAG